MDLSYQRSVTISKIIGKNKWEENLYGDEILYVGVELINQPLFVTENGRRFIKNQFVLTIYETLTKEGWIGAKVFDENHNLFYVNKFTPIYNEQNVVIKCQLIIMERSG